MIFCLFVYVVMHACVEVKGQPQVSFFRGTIHLIGGGGKISHWGLKIANKPRCPPVFASLALEL